MAEVFKNNEDLIEVNQQWLDYLKEEAKKSPNRRARLLMHHSLQDPVQEMIIAFCKDSTVTVHRTPKRSESLQVVEGEVLIVMFDEGGNITHRFEMGPLGSGKTFIYRIKSVPWHMVIPLTDIVVIHESLQGPFEKVDECFPTWIPQDTLSNKIFIDHILKNQNRIIC